MGKQKPAMFFDIKVYSSEEKYLKECKTLKSMVDSTVDKIFVKLFDLTDYPGTFVRGLVRNSVEMPVRIMGYSLALPTLYRRCAENKLENPRKRRNNTEFVNSDRITSHAVGSGLGMIAGAGAGLYGLLETASYVLQSANNGDYKPILILATTNVVSGIYEAGRFSIKRSLETISRREMQKFPETRRVYLPQEEVQTNTHRLKVARPTPATH